MALKIEYALNKANTCKYIAGHDTEKSTPIEWNIGVYIPVIVTYTGNPVDSYSHANHRIYSIFFIVWTRG